MVGAQLPIRMALLEPKHWLSPLPNFLPDEKYVGILRTFMDCTTLQSVCDYLFSNMPHTNNLARVFQGCTSLTTVPQHIFDGIWENLISPSSIFFDSGLTEVPVVFLNKNAQLEFINELFDGSKMLSKSGVVLDFSNCPAMSVLDYFWGNPTDTSISITPCTVKVRRNTSTAALFADKKANSNYKSTFNLQYVD